GADRRLVFVTSRKPGLVIGRMVESAIEDVTAELRAHASARSVASVGAVAHGLDLVERPERPSRLG
ncbi:MAG TPA: hypothetical protein VKA85_00875, partial [Candidatus Limnocylindrales bacterium]|nr:hypothetical protein [Candidatus Limnocylindrales bacterium]